MKILVIRFGSIGDIVLTTAVIRCLKQQIPKAELHFICKPKMKSVLRENPYISKIITFERKDSDLLKKLSLENYDFVVDLQKNKYSKSLCRKLKVNYSSFPKLNFRKALLVLFKINIMPDIHVVDRYFMAVSILNVKNDGKGLDFFLSEKDRSEIIPYELPHSFVAVAVGSQHATKQIPLEMLKRISSESILPLVFLGDGRDAFIAEKICDEYHGKTYNLCGKLSIGGSAACVEASKLLLTGDTGLMHIAAALRKNIVSVWGNTVPEFGMYPYLPQGDAKCSIVQNKTLFCRPCSKLGFKKCPLGNFNCMMKIPIHKIITILNDYVD